MHARQAVSSFLVLALVAASNNFADGALPPEVRRELTSMQRELREVGTLIRKKEVDAAKALVRKIEDRVQELMIEEDERDRTYKSLMTQLMRAAASVPVSFEMEVAPIIKDRCLRCHGANNPRANLRMDTYANMGRGGQSGALLIPRNPNRSLMIAKLMTEEANLRMPQNGQRLPDQEINIIGRWIAQGARFDGTDMTAEIGSSGVEPKPPIQVVMADGTETVSFTKDIAPWMVNVCFGCHSGNRRNAGYSLGTFEELLTDGDSGSTVVPGKPDESYIVDLVLRQDPIKMPQGNQVSIKRSQALALEKWIQEGAHFDGRDPKASLRSLVPTPAEIEAARLAAMSDSEFSDRRIEQAETLWKRAAGSEEARSATRDDVYVYGSTSQQRLDEIADWAQEHVDFLANRYKLADSEEPWRGRLIVFATEQRFDYEEFNTVLMNRQTPRGLSGHAVVTPNFDTAYVALFDVGDTSSADSLNTQQLLNSLLSEAFLIRSGAPLPDWMRSGFGLFESGAGAKSEYMRLFPQKAAAALATFSDPQRLFQSGTFAPDEVGPVGFLLVRFLLTNGTAAQFQNLIQAFTDGQNANQAIQSAYGQSAASLGQAFLRSGGR